MRRNIHAYLPYVILLTISGAVIGMSLSMKDYESKLLPLVVSCFVFILAGIAIWRTNSAKNQDNKANNEMSTSNRLGYLTIGTWTGGFFLAIYLFGFLIAIPLFLLGYLRTYGTKWLSTIIIVILGTGLIYVIFELALGARLFRGLISQ